MDQKMGFFTLFGAKITGGSLQAASLSMRFNTASQ